MIVSIHADQIQGEWEQAYNQGLDLPYEQGVTINSSLHVKKIERKLQKRSQIEFYGVFIFVAVLESWESIKGHNAILFKQEANNTIEARPGAAANMLFRVALPPLVQPLKIQRYLLFCDRAYVRQRATEQAERGEYAPVVG
jgi:hypothetical protein